MSAPTITVHSDSVPLSIRRQREYVAQLEAGNGFTAHDDYWFIHERSTGLVHALKVVLNELRDAGSFKVHDASDWIKEARYYVRLREKGSIR